MGNLCASRKYDSLDRLPTSLHPIPAIPDENEADPFFNDLQRVTSIAASQIVRLQTKRFERKVEGQVKEPQAHRDSDFDPYLSEFEKLKAAWSDKISERNLVFSNQIKHGNIKAYGYLDPETNKMAGPGISICLETQMIYVGEWESGQQHG